MKGKTSLILVFALTLAVSSWMLRWDVSPISGDGAKAAYLLDRWTGTVYFLFSEERLEVKGADKK